MQSCVHFFFFAQPTDRSTFTRGRAMGNETFYGDGLTEQKIQPVLLSYFWCGLKCNLDRLKLDTMLPSVFD